MTFARTCFFAVLLTGLAGYSTLALSATPTPHWDDSRPFLIDEATGGVSGIPEGIPAAEVQQLPLGPKSLQTKMAVAAAWPNVELMEAMERKLRKDKTLDENGTWALQNYYSQLSLYVVSAELHRDEAALGRVETIAYHWSQKYPDSVVAPVYLASAYSAHAQMLRGGEAANKVSKTQWAGFNKYMTLAAQTLAVNKEAQQSNPAWYATLLDSSTYLEMPPEAFAGLMATGLKLAPQYDGMVSEAAYFSSPQWGGSPEQLEALAQVALKVAGPSAYASLYARALQQNPCKCAYPPKELNIDWKTFDKGALDSVHTTHSVWLTNQYAAIACNVGRMDLLKALTPSLQQTGRRQDQWYIFEIQKSCTKWVKDSGFKDAPRF